MYSSSKPKYLDQLVANQKLTPDGRDWLILALDPFHDLNHQVAGYPDSDGSQTVVSCYQYQADITAPAGVAGNWDAHVFTLPTCVSNTGTITTENALWQQCLDTTTSAANGLLNIYSAPSGSVLFPQAPATVNSSMSVLGSGDIGAGISRVIGIGYEVTNTTAEINKQGTVTSYRMPQYASDTQTVVCAANGAATATPLTCVKWRQPPVTTAEANLLKGTRTWDAHQGVYATAVQNSINNPLKMLANTTAIYEAAAAPGGNTNCLRTQVYYMTYGGPPTSAGVIGALNKTTPYDTTGSMFTGLSNATTLTVKLKVYVEKAPLQAEPSLAVLATPSAGYDVVALELYSQAISQLPVAVTVAENGLGDWFKGVIRVIRDVVGTGAAVAAHAHPLLGGVAKMAGTALGKMDSFAPPKTRTVSVIRQANSMRPTEGKSKKKKKSNARK